MATRPARPNRRSTSSTSGTGSMRADHRRAVRLVPSADASAGPGMKYQFQVVVSLKPGLLDPQGKAIEGSLPAMGWANASNVRVGKYVELVVDAETEAAAISQVDEMARRVLSNPVIESYRIVASSPSLRFEDVP